MLKQNPLAWGPVSRTKLDLMGIRFLEAGGDATGAGAGESATGAGASTPNPADVAAAAAAANQPDDGSQPKDIWDDPAAARREIEKLRRENGDARINAKNQAAEDAKREQLIAVAKALGIEIPEGEKPTVDTLTEQLNQQTTQATEAQREANATKIELATYKEASKLGIDPDRLTNLRSFEAATRDLDPTSAEFTAKVIEAINAEVAKDQSLKRPGGTSRSGAENFGGAGGTQTLTKEQFAGLSIEDKGKLFVNNRSEFDRLSA